MFASILNGGFSKSAKKFTRKDTNKTSLFSCSPLFLQSQATKSTKPIIKNLKRTTFETPYFETSNFPKFPFQHPNSPYINEFPSGVIPSIEIKDLHDNPGSRKGKIILGRGIGSKKGKTSGRGHKGQKSRSDGGTRPGFEGGVPFYKRVRKFGFSNAMFKVTYLPLNLNKLQYFFDSGRLVMPVDRPLNIKDLKDAGVLTRLNKPVKLLGEGKIIWKGPKEGNFHIEVQSVSANAKAAVEDNGGKVTTVYFNKLGFREFLRKPLDQITINFAKCVKKPHKYDMPKFIRYSERGEENENNNNNEENAEEEKEEQ